MRWGSSIKNYIYIFTYWTFQKYLLNLSLDAQKGHPLLYIAAGCILLYTLDQSLCSGGMRETPILLCGWTNAYWFVITQCSLTANIPLRMLWILAAQKIMRGGVAISQGFYFKLPFLALKLGIFELKYFFYVAYVNHGLQIHKYLTMTEKQRRYNLEKENNKRHHKNIYHTLDFFLHWCN